MIDVGVARFSDPGICSVIVQGHGGDGGDIDGSRVCAGVSALVYALAAAVKNFRPQETTNVTLREGFAWLDWAMTKPDREPGGVLDVFCMGVEQIRMSHPDRITITRTDDLASK
ncbi:MAG: ribosomal-processing cysteine protease Prp [Oscillospiraceae bacterium]|jgi:uncharacterized protein YsxB (DUF464 family)|nr:ribosomal-processing cysteine protease Prp [Oscillospiraceae bacterium]